jgi:hemolysin activation/secretion protein
VGVGLDFQQRINYFQMNSFNVSYGYQWRETTTKSHEFFPIEMNYVKVSKITPEFQDILDQNPTLENSFQDQFIPGMRYSFTLNTQLKEQDIPSYGEKKIATSNFYFRGNATASGNLINLVAKNTASSDEQRPYQIFGLPYSQFLLGDVDFRYFWQMDRRNRLVSRIAFGAGYAYGNSTTLPYIKQFASGGSSSIRAFPARSFGPGTYNVYDDPNYNDTYYVDQRGDIKVEGNVEFRYDIFKMVKGALFVDAGNIWLWKKDENDERGGVEFDANTFLKELAVGTGMGIRFDFNFFILRFDLGIPIRKPYLPEGERWVFDQIDFGSKAWRRENLVLNIAIGYPF